MAQPSEDRRDERQRGRAQKIYRLEVPPEKLYRVEKLFPDGHRDSWKPAQPPLLFEKNVGQADPDFQFVLRSPGFAAGFHRFGITAAALPQRSESDEKKEKGYAFQLRFKNARVDKVVGHDPLTAKVNLIHGKDRSRWLRGVETFRGLVYRGLYRDIDMFTTATTGRLEYGFTVGPKGDVGEIQIDVPGISGLKLDRSGNLLMVTRSGIFVQTAPTFVESDGRKTVKRKGGFRILGRSTYGFEVDGRSRGASLVIDPEVIFVTYFGGSDEEGTVGNDGGAGQVHPKGFDLSLGSDGHLYLAGTTASPDFPATAMGELQGDRDAFALRIDPTLAPGQQLVYATFIGGGGFERGVGISAGENGSAYLVGCSNSSDFPTTDDAVQPTREASVGYLVRLDDEGLVDRGTFIGRHRQHHPTAVAYSKRASEDQGFVYVAGGTESSSSAETDATPDAFQPAHAGGDFDGFVVKFSADLTATAYLTYLGGQGWDHVMDLAVNDGFAFVTGSTESLDFPTTELAKEPDHSLAGSPDQCPAPECYEAFVARLHRSGDAPVYSTYLGGPAREFGRGIAVSQGNQATITGAARPTTGNDTEILALRLEGGGENLLWETRIPASRRDHGEEVMVDAFGRAHVVGDVNVAGLSTSETSFQGGGSDIFYARLAEATGQVEYFTYLGGSGQDRGFAVAGGGQSEENFCAIIAGSTTSEDVEVVSALEGGDELAGGTDVMLVGLCDLTGSISPSGFFKTCTPNVIEAASPGGGQQGESVTCTITVQNGGDVGVPVTIVDTVPDGLTVTGVDGDGCTRAGNQVTCSTVVGPGGTSIFVHARAEEACSLNLTNTATIQVGSEEFSASDSIQVYCPPPLCSNGVIDPPEECDGGPNCRPNCTLMECGDGILDPNEACDDGNSDDLDGCTSSCETVIPDGEECDGNPPCAGNLVCGYRCGWVECEGGLSILGVCLFGESYLLCTTEASCMPSSQATTIIG